jgi:3-phosphoshikimate 1-carboxyvinyltransferase
VEVNDTAAGAENRDNASGSKKEPALTLLGLNPGDPQGDKAFFTMLSQMGCEIAWRKAEADAGRETEWALSLSVPQALTGGTFDLNDTPDLLPAMAVIGLHAEGGVSLVNAAHARIKETDRIAVMAAELAKLGAEVIERPDGLIVRRGRAPHHKLNGNLATNKIGGFEQKVRGCSCCSWFPFLKFMTLGHAPGEKKAGKVFLRGHGDHRVVMALAAAALGAALPAAGQAALPVEIDEAESAAVTYPGFLELLEADIINTIE